MLCFHLGLSCQLMAGSNDADARWDIIYCMLFLFIVHALWTFCNFLLENHVSSLWPFLGCAAPFGRGTRIRIKLERCYRDPWDDWVTHQ